jgi:hypothetical protein
MRITDDGQPATADFRAAYDADNLYFSYDVNDPTPWKNSGNGFQLLFKTGDAAVEFVGENNPHSLPSILCRRLRQASCLTQRFFQRPSRKSKFPAYQYRIRPLRPVWKFPRRRVRPGGVRPFLQC